MKAKGSKEHKRGKSRFTMKYKLWEGGGGYNFKILKSKKNVDS